MAKIGTAHIEIKPILDDEALDVLAKRIEEAVYAGVTAGMLAFKREQDTLNGEITMTRERRTHRKNYGAVASD